MRSLLCSSLFFLQPLLSGCRTSVRVCLLVMNVTHTTSQASLEKRSQQLCFTESSSLGVPRGDHLRTDTDMRGAEAGPGFSRGSGRQKASELWVTFRRAFWDLFSLYCVPDWGGQQLWDPWTFLWWGPQSHASFLQADRVHNGFLYLLISAEVFCLGRQWL